MIGRGSNNFYPVVPAKAGTHNPCLSGESKVEDTSDSCFVVRTRHGVWVPAFAGTTRNVPRTSSSPPIQISNSQASSPVFFNGAGYAVFPPSPFGLSADRPFFPLGKKPRDGAPSGAPVFQLPHPLLKDAGASRRSTAAISVPGAVLPGTDPGGFRLNPIRRAFTR